MFAYVSYIWIARRAHSPLKNVSFARSHTTFFFFCSSHYRCPFRFFFCFFPPFPRLHAPRSRVRSRNFERRCHAHLQSLKCSQVRGFASPLLSHNKRDNPMKTFFFFCWETNECASKATLFFFFQLVLVLLAGTLTYIQLWWFLPFFLVVD